MELHCISFPEYGKQTDGSLCILNVAVRLKAVTAEPLNHIT
jgi:hypothetical protein